MCFVRTTLFIYLCLVCVSNVFALCQMHFHTKLHTHRNHLWRETPCTFIQLSNWLFEEINKFQTHFHDHILLSILFHCGSMRRMKWTFSLQCNTTTLYLHNIRFSNRTLKQCVLLTKIFPHICLCSYEKRLATRRKVLAFAVLLAVNGK